MVQLQHGYFELTQNSPLWGSGLTQNASKGSEWPNKAF